MRTVEAKFDLKCWVANIVFLFIYWNYYFVIIYSKYKLMTTIALPLFISKIICTYRTQWLIIHCEHTYSRITSLPTWSRSVRQLTVQITCIIQSPYCWGCHLIDIFISPLLFRHSSIYKVLFLEISSYHSGHKYIILNW